MGLIVDSTLMVNSMLHSALKIYTAAPFYIICIFVAAGAMRIPLSPNRPINESIHYLTDYYSQHFKLEQVRFSNQSDNAYYCFYGDLIQISGNQNIYDFCICGKCEHSFLISHCIQIGRRTQRRCSTNTGLVGTLT